MQPTKLQPAQVNAIAILRIMHDHPPMRAEYKAQLWERLLAKLLVLPEANVERSDGKVRPSLQ